MGVYWRGVLDRGDTIILQEGQYFVMLIFPY